MQRAGPSADREPYGEVEGLAASGQKTHAAYERLAKEVDSIVIRLSFTETGVRAPPLEAARSRCVAREELVGTDLGDRLPSWDDGLCEARSNSLASTAATEEEEACASADTEGAQAATARVQQGREAAEEDAEQDSSLLLLALDKAGHAAHGCCSALASLCTLMRKQLLMRENVQCLLDSCARSPALRRRLQQRLDEHEALWEALAVSCRQYCNDHGEAAKAPPPACH